MSNSTLKRYMALLEAVFLLVPLPAWFRNEASRLIKSPKIYLNDTGLVMHLRGMNQASLNDHHKAGFLLENFVVMELKKQLSWNTSWPTLYHFRTVTGKEVDLLMEARDGRIVGIEIKAGAEVGKADFSGMQVLAEQAGHQFHRGIVLYTGQESYAFSPNMMAMPVASLWQNHCA